MAEDEDKIIKVVKLQASIARVWQALTDYKEFGQWFQVQLDQPFAEGEKSTGHMTYPGHENLPWVAYIERMEEERLLSFRWNDFDETSSHPNEKQPTMLVEFKLEPIANGTQLTITESGFSSIATPRRYEVLRSNREGWDIQAENLARYLAE